MFKSIDLETVASIARQAGDAIMQIYDKNFKIGYKDDRSPLTEADVESNRIICQALERSYPEIPILSEENKEVVYEIRKDWEYYWCIDPIDGTKEFISKNGEFTVNIALIYKNTPVLGVVYAPVLDDIYIAKKGYGAFKNNRRLPLEVNSTPEKILRIVASKSHLSADTQRYIDEIAKSTETIEQVSKGSSLKLVMVAEGSADIYPRLAPTMEWDTAAAHAVVLEAGKEVLGMDSLSIRYNKKSLLNPWFVVR